MKRHVLIFGLVGGLLIATLQYTEYRFVVIQHSSSSTAPHRHPLRELRHLAGLHPHARRRETIHETVVVRGSALSSRSPRPEPLRPNAA